VFHCIGVRELTVKERCAAEGHRVLYDREVPFEIRNQTDPHDSAQEVVRSCECALVW
jgi:hypothetical protein